MIEQDTVRLLRECDAGVKMGVSSLEDVIPAVRSAALLRTLSVCREEHEALSTQINQQLARFGGNAGARGKDDLVKGLELGEFEAVVPEDRHLRSQRLHQMGKIVGEAVVIVDDNDFHTLTFLPPSGWLCAGRSACC